MIQVNRRTRWIRVVLSCAVGLLALVATADLVRRMVRGVEGRQRVLAPRTAPSLPQQPPGKRFAARTLRWLTPPWRRPRLSAVELARAVRVPTQAATIQRAVAQVAEGGYVLVAPGRYRENLVLGGKSVIVIGLGGPRRTTIDGGGKGPVVVFEPGGKAPSVLTGFRLAGGLGRVDHRFDPDHRQGGGIYVRRAAPVISWNLIEGNRGDNGGGITCVDDARPVIHSNMIRGNRAHKGGGIRASNASPVIMNNVISGNRASRLGGGIYWRQRSAPYVVGNTILGNRAREQGGGVFGSNVPSPGCRVVLVNNLIVNNQAPLGSALAVNLAPTEVELRNNLIGGGARAVYLAERGVRIRWSGSIRAPAGSVALAGFVPCSGFGGVGRAEPGWSRGTVYDFLGRPGAGARGAGGRTDVGAVEYVRGGRGEGGGYWGE